MTYFLKNEKNMFEFKLIYLSIILDTKVSEISKQRLGQLRALYKNKNIIDNCFMSLEVIILLFMQLLLFVLFTRMSFFPEICQLLIIESDPAGSNFFQSTIYQQNISELLCRPYTNIRIKVSVKFVVVFVKCICPKCKAGWLSIGCPLHMTCQTSLKGHQSF